MACKGSYIESNIYEESNHPGFTITGVVYGHSYASIPGIYQRYTLLLPPFWFFIFSLLGSLSLPKR
jgi:hypothetical protein